jgi:hypothetical protein
MSDREIEEFIRNFNEYTNRMTTVKTRECLLSLQLETVR